MFYGENIFKTQKPKIFSSTALIIAHDTITVEGKTLPTLRLIVLEYIVFLEQGHNFFKCDVSALFLVSVKI